MTAAFRRALFSGLSVWFLVTGFGAYFVYKVYKGEGINFGIDLVGGTYILLDVVVEKAVEAELAERGQLVIGQLRRRHKEVPVLTVENKEAVLSFSSEDAVREAELVAVELVGDMAQLAETTVRRDASKLYLGASFTLLKQIERDAVRSNISVLEARLNKFGVSEIQVAAHGDRSIIIELPNVHNPQQAKAIIGKAAQLEIKLVEDVAVTEQELIERYGGQIPEGFAIVPHKREGGFVSSYYLLPQYTDLTGRLLADAQSTVGGKIGCEPVVQFTFKPEGGSKFFDLTSGNIGRHIAIVLDGEVITAPVVRSPIRGSGLIEGNFTVQGAKDLAMLLKSGAFAAPVSFQEERTIGPSLGAESVRQGLWACIFGLFLLFLFSAFFYKVAGVFAFIVLLYNLLLILFALAIFGGTLTLPGVAGMILTVGMAIDSSILIYERMKEELALGSSFKKALNTGFSGALSVILDANITHLLVSIVLYKLGTGPIKGFAVTMIIGIISTLITGLVLLRALFDFVLNVLGKEEVKI